MKEADFIKLYKKRSGDKDKKIVKYEIPKAIVIVNKPFIELNNGKLITPSFKKKRNEFFNYFETEIHDALNNYTKNK